MEKNKIVFTPETHSYFLDGVKIPGVSEILQGIGVMNLSFVDKEVLEKNSKFGTAVHKTCELWDKNDLDINSLSAPLIPYLESYKKFIVDYKVVLNPADIEKIIYSERWRFAGTLDRTATINNKPTIIDLKSGDSLYPAMNLQLVGYKIAYEEMTKTKIKQRWIVQLKEDGYKVTECKEQSDESVFIGAIQLYRWKLKNGGIKNGKC